MASILLSLQLDGAGSMRLKRLGSPGQARVVYGSRVALLFVASSRPACPLHVTAGPTHVRQILSNLLSNAIKFTPEGGKIDVALEQAASHIVMRVRDNGRGIDPESLPLIFELFHKGDSDGTGLGIGLAVVKGLTEMRYGVVEARSASVTAANLS